MVYEYVGEDNRVKDVSLTIDANGVPHIAISDVDSAGSSDLYYATKLDGDWSTLHYTNSPRIR